MKKMLGFATLAAMIPVTPAFAGVPVIPGPEAGVGMGALAALGAGYALLRWKTSRK